MAEDQQQSGDATARPAPDDATKALVSDWTKKIQSARKHWEEDWRSMRRCMDIARLGGDAEWVAAGNYTVPVVQRQVNREVATLYAKNPTAVFERRKRLLFKLWDGTPEMLEAALAEPMVPDPAGMPTVDPMTGAAVPTMMQNPVLAEVLQVKQQEQMLAKVGKTLEILWSYYNDEQEPNFKKLMKQAVRRAKTCGLAYCWLDFQRLYEPRPDLDTRITDVSDKIARIERQLADVQAGDIGAESPELGELQASLADLQAQKDDTLSREGPIRDFPRTVEEIILDPATKQINGLIGTRWLARQSKMTVAQIKETWRVDIGTDFTPYRPSDKDRDRPASADGKAPDEVCVWRVYDKQTLMTFVIAEGHHGFVEPPAAPKVHTSRFWPLYVLTFNDVETEVASLPPSDVWNLRHPQQEYNRARQGLREHRVANRPGYVTPKGRLEEEDEAKIANRPAHALVHAKALAPGEKIGDLLQPLQFSPVDPALYDTAQPMQDILLGAGAQQANLGPTKGATATESSIAQESQDDTNASNTDDLDMFLTEIAGGMAEVMLLNLSPQTVTRIVGPGAVWPDLNRQQVAESITLTVKAGSSGKPNAAADVAKLERAMPTVIQLQGVNPRPIVSKYADLLDIDREEMTMEALPSITALNAMAGKTAGSGAPDDPNAQGPNGADNARKPQRNEPGGQPAYPGGSPKRVMRFDQAGNPAA